MAKSCRLDPDKLATTKAEFYAMEKAVYLPLGFPPSHGQEEEGWLEALC